MPEVPGLMTCTFHIWQSRVASGLLNEQARTYKVRTGKWRWVSTGFTQKISCNFWNTRRFICAVTNVMVVWPVNLEPQTTFVWNFRYIWTLRSIFQSFNNVLWKKIPNTALAEDGFKIVNRYSMVFKICYKRKTHQNVFALYIFKYGLYRIFKKP